MAVLGGPCGLRDRPRRELETQGASSNAISQVVWTSPTRIGSRLPGAEEFRGENNGDDYLFARPAKKRARPVRGTDPDDGVYAVYISVARGHGSNGRTPVGVEPRTVTGIEASNSAKTAASGASASSRCDGTKSSIAGISHSTKGKGKVAADAVRRRPPSYEEPAAIGVPGGGRRQKRRGRRARPLLCRRQGRDPATA